MKSKEETVHKFEIGDVVELWNTKESFHNTTHTVNCEEYPIIKEGEWGWYLEIDGDNIISYTLGNSCVLLSKHLEIIKVIISKHNLIFYECKFDGHNDKKSQLIFQEKALKLIERPLQAIDSFLELTNKYIENALQNR